MLHHRSTSTFKPRKPNESIRSLLTLQHHFNIDSVSAPDPTKEWFSSVSPPCSWQMHSIEKHTCKYIHFQITVWWMQQFIQATWSLKSLLLKGIPKSHITTLHSLMRVLLAQTCKVFDMQRPLPMNARDFFFFELDFETGNWRRHKMDKGAGCLVEWLREFKTEKFLVENVSS